MLTKDVNEAGRAADIAGDEWARPAWGRPAGWWAVVSRASGRASGRRTSWTTHAPYAGTVRLFVNT